jgi:nicotinate dehydrogenase subunit B
MAPVVQELAQLPDADIRAMAVYLASFAQATPSAAAQETLAAKYETLTAAVTTAPASLGARIYQGACAVCHEVGGLPLFGSRPSLALNSNLHSDHPDNLIQVILHGIPTPAARDLGTMPAFAAQFSDAQVAELVGYLRGQFAPDKPAWRNVTQSVARLRRR